MIDVYRIEHKNSGLGIFSHKENDEYHFLVDNLSSYYEELRSETKEKIYRTIGNDLTVDFNENILCGCLTLEDIDYWFGPFLNDIYKNDFMLVNYKVTYIIETKSKKQVGFYKKDILNKNYI
jgi:hypothetical protein